MLRTWACLVCVGGLNIRSKGEVNGAPEGSGKKNVGVSSILVVVICESIA